MNFYKSLFLLIIIIGVQSSGWAQKVKPLKPELIQLLDSIASKDVPEGAPGIATGIVLDGEIVYQRCYGYADLEDSILINEDSRFNIASNGKQYTALAILKLIEEGRVNLEDDIRKYLPSLYPDLDQKITVRNLLDHSSGVRDVYGLWTLQRYTWWEHTFDNADALALLEKQTDINFTPGSKHLYSNSNYILLALITEKVTKRSFVDFTREMFESVKMPNTSFVSDHTSIKGPIAKPYFNFDTWSTYDWIWNIHGDGNIFSSLTDQLTWEKLLQRNSDSALSQDLIEKSQSLITNSSIETYGYGLEFSTHQDIPYISHGGGTGAWKAITMRFPSLNLSIITLTNSGKTDPTSQSLAMIDALLGIDPKVKTFPIEPDKIGDFVTEEEILGTYQTDFGYLMKFVSIEGELFMQRTGRNDIKLLREADNVFHQWNDAPFKQEFTKNEKGEMQITAFYPTVPPFTLTRIEPDFSEFDFESLNGTYSNHETDVSFSLNFVEDDKYTIKIGTEEMSGTLLTPNDLRVENFRFNLESNDSGKIEGLSLNFRRIQNVKFQKIN